MSQHTEKMMNNEEYLDQDTNAVLDQKIMRQSWLRMLWVQASLTIKGCNHPDSSMRCYRHCSEFIRISMTSHCH